MLNRRTFLGSAVAANAALAGAVVFGAQKEKPVVEKQGQEEMPPLRAKQILGSQVTIDENMSVGTVDDIVIDPHGNVDYLIVINEDKKLVSIPWDAAQFNAAKRQAIVHISQDKYQEVPTYTPQQYPAFTTPTYRTQTYQYFGLTPGQQRRLMRRGGTVITK